MFFGLFGNKNKELGKVVHYFDKIQVAVVKLSGALKVGENVKVTGHGADFTMSVDSMQVDHQDVSTVKAGDEVAIKVTQPVKSGAVLFKA